MDFIDAYRIGFTSQKNYGIEIDLLAFVLDRYVGGKFVQSPML